jgi:hypothetical protein
MRDALAKHEAWREAGLAPRFPIVADLLVEKTLDPGRRIEPA